jgi:FKBP-type peptidyl-prolyl cis-trans isomerase (trigger factor)
MKFTINKLPKSEVEIEVEIEPAEFDKFFDEAVSEMAENVEVQGFRKGKAPKNIVIEKIGMDKIMLEGAEHAISHFYQQIVKGNNLEPISKPEIEIKKLAKGNPLIFKAKAFILPEIVMPDYKSIASKTKRKKVNVEEKEIDESLKWLAQNANFNAKTNPEEKMDVPEINDEFAKSIGNFESVTALKENIRQGMTAEKEKDEAQRIRSEIINNIINETKVDIPDILIDREQHALAHDFKNRVEEGMKMKFEDYLLESKKTEKDIVDSFKEEAEKKIRIFLVLKEIGEKENIKAEEKEVEEEANKMLEHFKNTEESRKNIDIEKIKEYVREVIRNEKIFQMLESLTK